MRPLLATAAALSLAALACSSQQTPKTDSAAPATATMSPSADPAAVRQAIDTANAHFVAAMVKGDTAAMVANYADDAVVLGAGEKAARGRAAIAKSMGEMAAAMKVTAFSLKTDDVIVADDYAIETGALEIAMQPKTGKAMKDVGKYLVVWQHQSDGSWKIIRDIWNSDGTAK
jgi:uncharacterized protein (TIGR02246 family)